MLNEMMLINIDIHNCTICIEKVTYEDPTLNGMYLLHPILKSQVFIWNRRQKDSKNLRWWTNSRKEYFRDTIWQRYICTRPVQDQTRQNLSEKKIDTESYP